MRTALAAIVLSLTACSAEEQPPAPVSACSTRMFEESRFTICDAGAGKVEIVGGSRSFAALQARLGGRGADVAFAMNAGMFDESGNAIGLLVQNGRESHPINLRSGRGNFHLMPNGVFLVRRNGEADVVKSADYVSSDEIAFASQSGPMLVIDGAIHPKFDRDGTSRYVRNGAGTGPSGAVFAISEEPVSLGKFARFFRDELKSRNALYFDGSVSSLWDPANGRMDSFAELGPMVVAFKASESVPGREAPATP
jgi:uncharacterized protein YigE (DUF2233 family)